MTHGQAKRIRRAAFALVAMIATIGAHVVAVGQAHVTPLMLVALLTVPGVAAAAPVSRGDFVPRQPLHVVAMLMVTQLGLHVVIGAVPVAFGLEVHGHRALFTPLAIAVHLVVGVQLGVLLAFADRLLGRAVRIVARLRTLLSCAATARAATPYVRIARRDGVVSSVSWGAHRGRGPPLSAAVESSHLPGRRRIG
ncbi:MAG TPA: hypothetical protein PLV41_11255 [Miltoncostaeales bacterium]|nr:hypothetical protein [Miltoncostaeales bacterium]